jgi:hypothetical protein
VERHRQHRAAGADVGRVPFHVADRVSAMQRGAWRKLARWEIIGPMELKVWFFWRPRIGDIHPVSLSKMDRFFFKSGKLEADAPGRLEFATEEERYLNYIQVIVAMEGRQALGVHSIEYFRVHTRVDGTLDRERYDEVLQASVDLAFGDSPALDDPPGIINAVSRFAERRLARQRWEPAQADEEKLREAINRKAGHAIF